MTEEEILQLLLARNEAGLEALEAAWGDPAMAVAVRILQNREDAEECVQDGLQRVWETVPSKKPDRLRYYFITLVRNRALELRRTARAKKRGGGAVLLPLEELAECVASSESVEGSVEAALLREALNRFLGTLSERDRGLFLRRYYYAEELDAIAACYGLSVRHVSVLLFRTRKKLKNYLQKEELL
jgi:RNA polymerase sigma-70 factor (ECF subfamily)